MKKSLIYFWGGVIALAAAALMSVSCTKDEINSSDILGTWRHDYCDYKVYANGKVVDSGRSEDDAQVLKFMSGGVGEYYYGDYGSEYPEYNNFTWKINGNKLTLYMDGLDNDMVDIDGDQIMKFTITSIDSDSMQLTLTQSGVDDGVKMKSVLVYNYKKIED